MKKKGFTLIELLAVIVILAIIAIIAVPTLSDVINKAKLDALKSSINGIYDASELYIIRHQIKNDEEVTFTCDGKKCSTSTGDILKFKGQVPLSGNIVVSPNKPVRFEYVEFPDYFVLGTKDNLDIKSDKNDLSLIKPDVNLTVSDITSNSFKVSVSAEDKESNIKEITYTIDNKTYKETYDSKVIETSKVFNNLKNNKKYSVQVTVKNEKNTKETKIIEATTSDLANLAIMFTNNTSASSDGYFDIIEAYPNISTQTNGYYVKSDINVKSNINISKTCSNELSIDKCSNASGKVLTADTWYYFSETPTLIYDTPKDINSNLYIIATDGNNNSNITTALIGKIEKRDGLREANGKRVASWRELTQKYNVDIEKDYTEATKYTYNSSGSPLGYLFGNEDSLFYHKFFRKLIIPEGVKRIGSYAIHAFEISDVVIPSSVTEIGENGVSTFAENYNISKTLTNIGNRGLNGICLNTLNVDDENPVYEDMNSNIVVEKATKKLILGAKQSVIPNGVTKIGNGAFHSVEISNLVIPGSVKSIEEYAFLVTPLDGNLVFSEGLEQIDQFAFGGNKFTKLTLPNSLTKLDIGAFWQQAYLTTVEFGSGLRFIGWYAFHECNNLNSVKFINASGWYACSTETCEVNPSQGYGKTSVSFSNSTTSTNLANNANTIKTYNEWYLVRE